MTATPKKSDLDQLWFEHQSNVSAVEELSAKANEHMSALVSTLKQYRLHKKRCSTEKEVDYGVLVELILQLELTVQDY